MSNSSHSVIEINKDVNSVIFLHASEKQGKNEKAYRMIWDQIGTAQLLGWYEIIYKDGFKETIPVRYWVNILDRGWKQRVLLPSDDEEADNQKYVYQTDAVELSGDSKDPDTFFLYEWSNPRPGVKIKSVNMKSADTGSAENSIILKSVSITETPALSKSKGTENE